MDPSSEEYTRLARYLAQSHGSTHHWDIKLVDVGLRKKNRKNS